MPSFILKDYQNIVEEIDIIFNQQLPSGSVWSEVENPKSNIYVLIKTIGEFFSILFNSIFKKKTQLRYTKITEENIEFWEAKVGIPDNVFTFIADSLENRILNVKLKLFGYYIQNINDFNNLVKYFFGNIVEILESAKYGSFPYTFPFTFYSQQFLANTIFVRINSDISGFPYTFPFTFGSIAIGLLENYIKAIIPYPYNVVFVYNNANTTNTVNTDSAYLVTSNNERLVTDDGSFIIL